MAGQLIFCTDNFFSPVLYPSHVLSADEEAAGQEVHYLGSARRHTSQAWQATTANADHWVKVNCGVARTVNFLAIDRASNHAGKRFLLESSPDDAVWTTRADITFPAAAGGTPADANGCLTDEGAGLKTITDVSAQYWRITSKAMGVGLTPRLVNVMLGKAWIPTDHVVWMPLQDERYGVSFASQESEVGWVGTSRVIRPREGTLTIRPIDTSHEAAIRTYIIDHFGRGRRAWIVWQKTDAPTRAVFARTTGGAMEFARDRSWKYRYIDLPYIEDQPVVSA